MGLILRGSGGLNHGNPSVGRGTSAETDRAYHSLFLYGSGISDGNLHFHLDLPTVLAGGGGGHVKGGRHLRYTSETPLSNLHMTVLDKLGLPVEAFGDSTGALALLSDV